MIYLHGSLTTSKSSTNHSSTHASVHSFWGIKTQATCLDTHDDADAFYPVPYKPPGVRGRMHSMMKPIRRAFASKKKSNDEPEQDFSPLHGIKFYLKRAAGSHKVYEPMIADMDSCDIAQLLNPLLSKSHIQPSCTTAYSQSNDRHESPLTVESAEKVIRSVNTRPSDTTFLGRSKTLH